MSLSSYLVSHLHKLEEQWARAIKTLPDDYLTEERDVLRERAVDTIGLHQAEALVLRLLNNEIRRRQEGEATH